MRRLTCVSTALFFAFWLTGCATGYGPSGLTGGYKDIRIDDATYIVRFDGNGYAQSDRVWFYWIYRCAELTKQKGYTSFTLAKAPTEVGSTDPDSDMLLAGAQQANGWGFIRTTGQVRTTYIYIPGHSITTWHSKAIVKMFNDGEPPAGVITAISAQKILDQLHDYVQSNGKIPALDRDTVIKDATIAVSFIPWRDA